MGKLKTNKTGEIHNGGKGIRRVKRELCREETRKHQGEEKNQVVTKKGR